MKALELAREVVKDNEAELRRLAESNAELLGALERAELQLAVRRAFEESEFCQSVITKVKAQQ